VFAEKSLNFVIYHASIHRLIIEIVIIAALQNFSLDFISLQFYSFIADLFENSSHWYGIRI